MPNWCLNNLSVTGSKAGITLFRKWLGEDGFTLQKIKPMPAELEKTTAPNPHPGSKESKALVEKYGSDNWYDWNVKNWGTKWDVEAEINDDDGLCMISFDSAWSPPIDAIAELSKQFPKLHFSLKYFEPGCVFAGEANCKAGKVNDNFYEGTDNEEYREIAEFFDYVGFDDEDLK